MSYISPRHPRVHGSVSNVSEHAIQRAVHSTSRGSQIRPSSIGSAGSRKMDQQSTIMGIYYPYEEGVKMYAPQPQIPMTGYYGNARGSSNPHLDSRLSRSSSSVARRREPPHPTASPRIHVGIAIEDVFRTAGITVQSQKSNILARVE